MSSRRHGVADLDAFQAGDHDDVAGACLLDWHAGEPLEAEHLAPALWDGGAVAIQNDQRVARDVTAAGDAADAGPALVLVVADRGDEHLEAAVEIGGRRRDVGQDRLEQGHQRRLQGVSGVVPA